MARGARVYYLLSGCYNLAQYFLAPLYPLFLLSRGLDVFQMDVVLATFLITVFLFDVPTGAIADMAGRKRAFVAGCVVRMGAFALYTRTRGFHDCLVAEFIDAIGTSFCSGALDAWAVDTLAAEGDARPMDRLFARASVVARALMIVGGIVSGYLAERDFIIPWLVASGLFGLTGVLGAALMTDTAAPASAQRRSFVHTATAGVLAVGASPVLLLLCALTLCGAFGALPIHMLWQPHLQALGADRLRLMGWVVALLNLASLIGSALLPRLLARFAREAVLAGAALWRAMMVAVMAAASSLWPAATGFLLQEIAFGLSDPVTAAWTNEHVASRERATVLSVRSTFFTLGGASGLVVLGLVARHVGIPAALTASATVFALTAPGFLVLGRVARRVVADGEAVGEVAPVPTKVTPPVIG